MDNEYLNKARQWTTRDKLELVVSIIKSNSTIEQACARHNLCEIDVRHWIDEAVKIMEATVDAYPQSVMEMYEQKILAIQCEYIDAVQKRDSFILYQIEPKEAASNVKDVTMDSGNSSR